MTQNLPARSEAERVVSAEPPPEAPSTPLGRGFRLAVARARWRVRGARRSRIARIALTFLAMIGWRLEHLTPVWLVGGAASLAAAHALMARADWRLTVSYFVLTLVFYYGGNSLILASGLPRWAARRYGERRAWRAYESLLGIMFLNQGLGIGCMAALSLPGLHILNAAPWLREVGALLFLVGIVVKGWATWLVGADTFYYKDLFLRRPGAKFVKRGPYRVLRNPMYGVGQLQGYGYALVAGSLLGVLAAGIGQLLIYAFFFTVERPFVRVAYRIRDTR
jgi:protein-S-isoprenylcysteine O-methyltransferase Ste14